jgi:hypothetical protein
MVTPLIYREIFNTRPDRTFLIDWLNFKRREKYEKQQMLRIKTEYAILIEWLNYMQQQKCNNIQQCCCDFTSNISDGYIIEDTIYYDDIEYDQSGIKLLCFNS